jgi:hypothetical protein
MNVRTRIRRWWIGPALYDRATATVAVAEQAEQQGKANAHEWLRANGLGHLIREDAE